MLRNYLEQSRIPSFESLGHVARRTAVERERHQYLLALQKQNNPKLYRQVKKNYKHTSAFIHLTRSERRSAVSDVADCLASWGWARLFAECIDKLHFDPYRSSRSIDEQAFEQVVSRFEQYLANTETHERNHGLLVHDNSQTIALKHTRLMRQFHVRGTLWTRITRIIETPLFVDSSLTRMVQLADLCSYALRRYVENQESDLFRRIFVRADKVPSGTVVGVRHFSDRSCNCDICIAHRRPLTQPASPP